MRYVAISLLLANLVYFGWASLRPDETGMANSRTRQENLLNTGITLLSEYQPGTEMAEVGAEGEEQSLLCSRVSGLESVDAANSLMYAARQRGLEAQLELTGQALPAQYRVYLPPASSRAIATITLDGLGERLAEENLAIETYLITRGPLENGISLGVFSERNNAQEVRNQIRELGYQPEIEEIPRSDGELLVWLKPTTSVRLEEAEWLDLSAERPGLSRSENLCQTIALPSQFP